MFVRHIHLDEIRVAGIDSQHARSEQRNIVKLNDVESPRGQNIADLFPLQPWFAGLLSQGR